MWWGASGPESEERGGERGGLRGEPVGRHTTAGRRRLRRGVAETGLDRVDLGSPADGAAGRRRWLLPVVGGPSRRWSRGARGDLGRSRRGGQRSNGSDRGGGRDIRVRDVCRRDVAREEGRAVVRVRRRGRAGCWFHAGIGVGHRRIRRGRSPPLGRVWERDASWYYWSRVGRWGKGPSRSRRKRADGYRAEA